MSLLRLPRLQRHSGRLDEALLKVMSPTQLAAAAVTASAVTAVTAVAAGAAG